MLSSKDCLISTKSGRDSFSNISEVCLRQFWLLSEELTKVPSETTEESTSEISIRPGIPKHVTEASM